MLSDFRCRILENRECGHQLRVMTLQALSGNPAFLPGQFVMFDLPSERFFFRRPFSVLDAEGDRFRLYYKVVGKGTAMMAEMRPGQEANVLGPLGNAFELPAAPEKAVLVGGGIGIAPLYFLAKALRERGSQTAPLCFYGVRSQSEIGLKQALEQVTGPEKLIIATDDGSEGFHGNVCQAMARQAEWIRRMEVAYICGPTRMMAASVHLLQEMNPALRIFVSLEEHMPCGTGACTGCVVELTEGRLPAKVCVEGPVFDADLIQWAAPSGLEKAHPKTCEEERLSCFP